MILVLSSSTPELIIIHDLVRVLHPQLSSWYIQDDWLEHNDFRRIVPSKMRLPRIDAIRDSLNVIEITDIVALHHSIIRTSTKNKLVRNGTIDGYTVVAFDGVELFESTKKSCDTAGCGKW